MHKILPLVANDRPNHEIDMGLGREEIGQTDSFGKWAMEVMSGMQRLGRDPVFRARIEAMVAAASPKMTMQEMESSQDHPR